MSAIEPRAGFPFWPVAGPLFAPFLCAWIGYAVCAAVLFLLRLRTATDGTRSQILLILAGTVIGYLGGITNYFLWYGIPFPPYGTISASIYIGFVAYAILRLRLFNIKMIGAELAVLTLWLTLFIRMILDPAGRTQTLDFVFLMFGLVIGALLIRATDREVEQRERIEAQELQLEAFNRDLTAANGRQENLLHFLSHEVKGYLTKSQGAFSGILENDYGDISAGLRTLATGALAEMRRGVETVTQILQAGDLKKGTISFTMKPFDFRASVAAIVAELKPDAEAKHLSLEFTFKAGADYTVVGDEPELARHVVLNLIDNAIRYTRAGRIDVLLARLGETVRLTVTDTGIGITPEDKARLFTEGGRGKDSVKTNVHSTGYGLFIAKILVEAHHGRIWAESNGPGNGAEFLVELQAAGNSAVR